MVAKNKINIKLNRILKDLHLPSFRKCFSDEAADAVRNNLGYEEFLLQLCEIEAEERTLRKTARLIKQSRIPLEKSIEQFDRKMLPKKVSSRINALLEGDFIDRRENVLAFGNPGSGKTHLLCAIGLELIRKGRKVFFTDCNMLVQGLLKAKQELGLEKYIKKLAKYEALIIDDLGYVQQAREEMEVLFTLLAQRYETGSVMLTSNLPFSKWENIFKDPMTTAAAIDRLVHHSVILEMNIESYRLKQAKSKKS